MSAFSLKESLCEKYGDALKVFRVWEHRSLSNIRTLVKREVHTESMVGFLTCAWSRNHHLKVFCLILFNSLNTQMVVLHSEFFLKTHCFMKAYADFNRKTDVFCFCYIKSCYESIRNVNGVIGEKAGARTDKART